MLISFCINIKEKYPLVLSRSGHRATPGLILMQWSHFEMLNWCQTMMTQETEEKLQVSTSVHLSVSLSILCACVIHPEGSYQCSVLASGWALFLFLFRFLYFPSRSSEPGKVWVWFFCSFFFFFCYQETSGFLYRHFEPMGLPVNEEIHLHDRAWSSFLPPNQIFCPVPGLHFFKWLLLSCL